MTPHCDSLSAIEDNQIIVLIGKNIRALKIQYAAQLTTQIHHNRSNVRQHEAADDSRAPTEPIHFTLSQ